MPYRLVDFSYIAATIAFTVYGQLVLKWRLSQLDPLPAGLKHKVLYLVSLVADPVVLSAYVAAFLASLAWLATLTRFDLNYAYPLMSLSFVLVLVLSSWLLGEPLASGRMLGVGLILLGTVIVGRS